AVTSAVTPTIQPGYCRTIRLKRPIPRRSFQGFGRGAPSPLLSRALHRTTPKYPRKQGRPKYFPRTSGSLRGRGLIRQGVVEEADQHLLFGLGQVHDGLQK